MRIEKLDPCPYVIPPWTVMDKTVSYILKKYTDYWDVVFINKGTQGDAYRIFCKT